ncbi:amino acid aminotransferase [Psychrobium sp. 1_MG-2023]|uniref:amino acid aminotransferase n=1 Tax=Psychrobium sp. 1_MG-2023 TaxID=3062624 RepID=UPI000C325100|nr:amino acid aminotransferase [Psychrobium sp. 1_MG-2023]MDP2562331.1 amino acid aminotransferase [Psychrobium sp. 1_MG-2023]PKF58059.1 aromatic amino acid aminotransferase [Alteromonadales bacterium alter-6D02]
MLEHLSALPADPILGLLKAYGQDTNPNKVDLGVGVFKDDAGHTPILACVKTAEQFRIDNETSKIYIGPTGEPEFNRLISELVFGEHDVISQNRSRTLSTPGGTGALRVAGEFIKACKPNATIWLSNPTWANHEGLFSAAGLNIASYPYYDYENKCLDFDGMLSALSNVPAGDIVLLHACCHNPSGMDLTKEQWQQVTALAKEKGFTPLIDMAYQGFGQGLEEDAYGPRLMAKELDEVLLCTSCSKNFGLYRERIGGFTLVAKNSNVADIAYSVALSVVRSIYSMPPAHGAAIVSTILNSDELTGQWHQELAQMRDRIATNRQLLVEHLKLQGVERDFSFITRQSGMFSFLGITPEQVATLINDYSIYMVDSSRISIAGISKTNVEYLAQSIAKVIK